MKKTYEFKVEKDKFLLCSTNPNEKREPFTIDRNDLQFNSKEFYQYVFSNINAKTDIEIKDQSDQDDKLAKRVYEIIDDIAQGVAKQMNETIFTDDA